jgi:hypothetical protein
MTQDWNIFDNECALEGLITEPFWSGVERLFRAGEMELVRDLVAALQIFVENRSRWYHPTPADYIECLDLHLVELPYLLGGGWALGIDRKDKDCPIQFLISREPIKDARPLVAEIQPPRPHWVAA